MKERKGERKGERERSGEREKRERGAQVCSHERGLREREREVRDLRWANTWSVRLWSEACVLVTIGRVTS